MAGTGNSSRFKAPRNDAHTEQNDGSSSRIRETLGPQPLDAHHRLSALPIREGVGRALDDTSTAENGIAALSVQDKRRQGIYGIEALGVINPMTTNQSSDQSLTSRTGPNFAFQFSAGLSHSNHLTNLHVNAPDQFCAGQNDDTRPRNPASMGVGQISKVGNIDASNMIDKGSFLQRNDPASDACSRPLEAPSPQTQGLPMRDVKSLQSTRLSRQFEENLDLERDAKGKSNIGGPNIPAINNYHHPFDHKTGLGDNTQPPSRKRKHAGSISHAVPAPAFVWRGTTDAHFTIFQGFLLYPELCFLLAAHLELRDLISLYSISRDFHKILNSRLTTMCLTIARNRAPQSAKTFHFRMYAPLCRPDPANRIPHPDPVKAAKRQPRMVPSFRWVAFVLFREKVVHELMAIFAERGVPLPPRCEIALKKMWLLMDIPDNARRIGLIHNRQIISDVDLYFMFCFLVRLDMVCHDPLAAQKCDGLRKLMLSQRDGLLSILLVMKRVKWKREADLLIAWVRHSCEIQGALDHGAEHNFDVVAFGAESIFGVPVREAGLGKYEYWGTRGAIRRVDPLSSQGGSSTAAEDPNTSGDTGTSAGPVTAATAADSSTSTGTNTAQHRVIRFQLLLRPDQLIPREAIRRNLNLSRATLKALLYGYIDNVTFQSLAPRPFPRRIPEWNNEEYAVDDLIGGAQALDVLHGGDPLLDLGDTRTGTPLIVQSYNEDGNDNANISDSPMVGLSRRLQEEEARFLTSCLELLHKESHFDLGEDVRIGTNGAVAAVFGTGEVNDGDGDAIMQDCDKQDETKGHIDTNENVNMEDEGEAISQDEMALLP